MKLRQIWQTRDSLAKLLRSDLSIALAWRLKPLAAQVSELENSYIDLLRKHGTQNGQMIEVPPDNQAAFMAEFDSLMDEELAIELKPISPAELDGVKLSPVDLTSLDYLIKDEANPPA